MEAELSSRERHYEYKNIVFKDFHPIVEIKHHSADPSLDFTVEIKLPPELRRQDLKVMYVRSQDSLVIEADAPSGGIKLVRVLYKYAMPKDLQGDETKAEFKKGSLILRIPHRSKSKNNNSNTDPHPPPAQTSSPRSPDHSESGHQKTAASSSGSPRHKHTASDDGHQKVVKEFLAKTFGRYS